MTRQGIAFPNTAAALGGASRVEYSARFAWIHLPDQAAPVRLPLSKLPPVDQWTAFNLADAAKPAEEPARDLAAELNEAERLLSLANPSDNDEATREWNRYCHAHGISESTRRQMIAAKLERERAELDDARPATAGRLVSTIARMEPTTDPEDAIATVNRLIQEAREISPNLTAAEHIRAAVAALPPLDFTGSVRGSLNNATRATLERIAADLAPAAPLLSINPAGEIAEMIDDDETAGRLADLARELWEAMTPEQRSHIIRARVNERP